MRARVVALHGFTGARESFSEISRALDAVARVEAISLTGHEGTTGGETFDDEVARLAWVISQGADRCHLLGYSLGGRLGLGLLAMHPKLFQAATIVSAHPGLECDAQRSARREADERWVRLLEDEGLTRFVEEWERTPLFAPQKQLPERAQADRRAQRLSHDAAGLAQSLRSVGLGRMPALQSRLAEIDVPITWIVGARDSKFVAIAERVVPMLRRGRLVVVPKVGHDVVLEAPDSVSAAVRSTLAIEAPA